MGESMSQEELDAMLKSMAGDAADAAGQAGSNEKTEPQPQNSADEKTNGAETDKLKKPLVQRVEFPQLKARTRPLDKHPRRNLFNNIPLVVSGELGTAEITVRELLALEEESVVKLDKIAGESATVLVNEQFLGQAETVVVNDRFGLRITTIGKEELKDKKEESGKEADKTSGMLEETTEESLEETTKEELEEE